MRDEDKVIREAEAVRAGYILLAATILRAPAGALYSRVGD